MAADRRKRRALVEVVLDRLGERYDHPTWGGPRLEVVSELVLTILAQNTADLNSYRAFTALSDRTRRDIVARLSAGEATVKELAEPYAMSMQAVSQHIRVLERCGLISQGHHTCDTVFFARRDSPFWN